VNAMHEELNNFT
jgi:hypothetical protein